MRVSIASAGVYHSCALVVPTYMAVCVCVVVFPCKCEAVQGRDGGLMLHWSIAG